MIMQRYKYFISIQRTINRRKMFESAKIVGIPTTTAKISTDTNSKNINKNIKIDSSSQQSRLDLHTTSAATLPAMVEAKTYEDAIKALNKLQSNALTIKKSILNSKNPQNNNIKETVKYLKRSGITLDDLDKLSVIHVTGTKGKGSSCALTESILRSFGVKTGFFSSPHLISVTERIRINGEPICYDKFNNIFWKVYDSLNQNKEYENDMPAYFKFLTILSFHIFFDEKVDVAIVEVGIGGENDCTNVVRNTKTVGITSLGLEHTNLLGNTLEEIAWQKAGIIKEKSNVFTLKQPEECIKVIMDRAKEKNAILQIVPEFSQYNWKEIPKLQIQNKVQHLNASLAIQLAYDWLRKNKLQQLNGFSKKIIENKMCLDISENMYEGLSKCFWPGRCQLVEYHNFKIYLDGAHTVDSIDICIDWFKRSTEQSKNSKLLIFNTTGDRDAKKLLSMLSEQLKFTKVYFVPNIPFQNAQDKNHDISTVYSNQEQIKRAQNHSIFWNTLTNTGNSYSCILDALNEISKEYNNKEFVEILVTGSLHLIGATILAVEEHEKNNTKNTLTAPGNSYSCILDALNEISKEFNNKEILVTSSLHFIGATILAVEKHEKKNTKV